MEPSDAASLPATGQALQPGSGAALASSALTQTPLQTQGLDFAQRRQTHVQLMLVR